AKVHHCHVGVAADYLLPVQAGRTKTCMLHEPLGERGRETRPLVQGKGDTGTILQRIPQIDPSWLIAERFIDVIEPLRAVHEVVDAAEDDERVKRLQDGHTSSG